MAGSEPSWPLLAVLQPRHIRCAFAAGIERAKLAGTATRVESRDRVSVFVAGSQCGRWRNDESMREVLLAALRDSKSIWPPADRPHRIGFFRSLSGDFMPVFFFLCFCSHLLALTRLPCPSVCTLHHGRPNPDSEENGGQR